jgi:uncharacterized protein (DUF39 family)/NAD-dependent dihydropyrimidine dehydrogenase PreA subunit
VPKFNRVNGETGEKTRSIGEINDKIRRGDAQVLTAEEMKKLVENSGVEVAFREVDVVTTGTFGAMCSSGAVINLGHSDPPIKISRAWINDVEVCHPGAAVDLFIGATCQSETRSLEYGGGHLIEDLVRGKEVELRATGRGTECYPRTSLRTTITKDDLNQFYLINFRNCYQRYNCATNSGEKTIYTYMGKLLPRFQNATFSGAGALNPLMNDPDYETIGIGTRIFLGGGKGYVIGEGTQHNPASSSGTVMVRGDCKEMKSQFLRGATFSKYGTTLYVGVGIPIPILNEKLARATSITDAEVLTDIVDYGIPRRDRPKLGKVSYKDLKSGRISILDRKVMVSSLSSLKTAREIAEELKTWIENSSFYLSAPVERLPASTVFKPMAPPKFTSEDTPPSELGKSLVVPHEVKAEKITSNDKRKTIEIDQKVCVQCGACISLCPQKAIAFTEKYSVTLDKSKCRGGVCGTCVDSCPVRAIHLASPTEASISENRAYQSHQALGRISRE